MICEQRVTPFLLIAATALAFATVYLASPLTVCVLVAAVPAAHVLSRGMPSGERRALLMLIGGAFALRLLLIAAQALIGIPLHSAGGVGALSGDEAYYLSRSLRTRDLMLGLASTKYDFFVAADDYGRTSYVAVLTALQVFFGPTPYGMKVLNAMIFVAGGTLLFRFARTAFGTVPAFVGLAILLFLPSLLVASVSLLKESLYSLVAAGVTVSVLAVVRQVTAAEWQRALFTAAAGTVCLWLLNDLRRGAMVLALAGLALAAVIRFGASSRPRAMATLALAVGAIAAVVLQPALQEQALARVATVAKMHAGHVFTVGHSYKLLDEGFYKFAETAAAWDLVLTAPQALRFLVRAAVSFVVVPWPWEMRSLGELAFLPELMLWYLMVLAFPIGVVAGWRLNRTATSVWVGMLLPTAAVLAVTTGNVGTLLRLRGLVILSMVWLSAVGFCVIAQWLLAQRERPARGPSARLTEAVQS
jgi:hypothetical protein